jgi:hypothetical protein
VSALRRGSLTVLEDTPHPIEQVSADALGVTLVPFFEESA